MTRFVQMNLNYARPAKAQQRDVEQAIDEGADVTATCEDVRGKNRERVNVHGRRLRVEKRGARLAALSLRRQRIGWRRFAWKDVETPDLGTIRVVSAHMPPLRMRGALYGVYALRLRMLLRSSPHPWICGADWNWLIHNDPARLESKLGAKFYGRRIDGWAVHPGLVKHVTNCRIHDPKRRDNHVYTTITLEAHR